jgi:hypothetical protein
MNNTKQRLNIFALVTAIALLANLGFGGSNCPVATPVAQVADPTPAGNLTTGTGSADEIHYILGTYFKYWIEDNPDWQETGRFNIGAGVSQGSSTITYTVSHAINPTFGWVIGGSYSYVHALSKTFQVTQNGHDKCNTTVVVWQEVNEAALKRVEVEQVGESGYINVGSSVTQHNKSIGISNYDAQMKIGS